MVWGATVRERLLTQHFLQRFLENDMLSPAADHHDAIAMVCGGLLMLQALQGGFREREEPSGAAHGDWVAMAWVSAGVLVTAGLITRVGFVLACGLCFALAVRGLRGAEGRPTGGMRQTGVDLATGLAIALPVYWLFTKLLAINLPGLTGSGWI